MGGKLTQLTMHRKQNDFFAVYFLCTLPIVLGVVWMGIDNARQLARCEATSRGPAECRLLVLGR